MKLADAIAAVNSAHIVMMGSTPHCPPFVLDKAQAVSVLRRAISEDLVVTIVVDNPTAERPAVFIGSRRGEEVTP